MVKPAADAELSIAMSLLKKLMVLNIRLTAAAECLKEMMKMEVLRDKKHYLKKSQYHILKADINLSLPMSFLLLTIGCRN